MATRSNILLKDEYGTELWFYRHWDGYPEGAMPTIAKFVELVNSHKIRGNAGQSGGWLIWLGMQENGVTGPQEGNDLNMDGWKVGSIEPTHGEHVDIEYRYTINLVDGWGVDGLPRAEVICEEVSGWEEHTYTAVDVSKFLQPENAPTPIAKLNGFVGVSVDEVAEIEAGEESDG